jgi:minor extracellular serine protease Vpr
MRKALVLVFAFMLTVGILPIDQAVQAKAIEKIDSALLDLRSTGNPEVEVFVRLSSPCVVEQATFNGLYSTKSSELMNIGNKFTKTAISSVLLEQKSVKEKIAKIVAGKTVSWMQYAGNAFCTKVSLEKAIKFANISEVSKVYYIPPMELHRFRSKKILNTEKVWSEVLDPKGRKVDGSGVLCSISDTGVDYTHQDFGSQKSPVGKKVIISRDLADNDNDCQEISKVTSHGTACAGIVAADGPGTEKGMAPKALLAGYKIAKSPQGGLSGQGIFDSFEFLIKDKIQVSNNSYGAPYGSANNWLTELQSNAVKAGCVIVASQGNNGSPGKMLPFTSGSTAASHDVIAVGATDDTDINKIQIVDAPDQGFIGSTYVGFFGNTGKTFPNYENPIEVVDCGWGRPEDFESLDVKGKAALIQRGPSKDLEEKFGKPLFWKDKALNAAKAGAKMIIVYNYDAGKLTGISYAGSTQNAPLDPNLIPSFHLLKQQGLNIRKQLHAEHEWTLGIPDQNQNKVIIKISSPEIRANLAGFTSSGPTQDLFLKPDVSAPGEGIRTAAPFWETEKYTDSFGGTSAAGPFVAGCTALMIQARPELKPLEIKRALMNTATILKRAKDDSYVLLTSQGQGRVNIYDAIKADIMIQPPSALIVSKSKDVRAADFPKEWLNSSEKAQLDLDVKNSLFPLKLYNYNTSKTKNLEISYEINSRYPELINVSLTSESVSVAKAKSNNNPSSTFVGVNIDYPSTIKGEYNDIFIFVTDKETGRKYHVGVCIYGNNSRTNTFASGVVIDPVQFTPNGDGETDKIKLDYTVTNGSPIDFSGYATSYYDNYAGSLTFWAVDQNSERWVKIYEEADVELGFHSFEWDGRDENGNYILPEGEWRIQVLASGTKLDMSARAFVPVTYIYNISNAYFEILKSTVSPLPTLFAFSNPVEPGVGQEFEVGVYLKHAMNLKSIQFKLDFSNAKGVVKYLGVETGEFMSQNEHNTLHNFDYDEEKETLFVDIQRPLDGVSGEGYLLKLRFLALEQNFFDFDFNSLLVSVIDANQMNGLERTAKAFYKKAEFVIQKQAYDKLDFNLDGQVDGKDLMMISSKLGTKRGDSSYFWRCDLNFDSLIDFSDFAEFAKNYN